MTAVQRKVPDAARVIFLPRPRNLYFCFLC